MLAQSLYSHNELYKKNGSDMQEMCFQKGHNWNDLDFSKKRGSFVVKNMYVDGIRFADGLDEVIKVDYSKDTIYAKWDEKVDNGNGDYVDIPDAVVRSRWECLDCPIFSKERFRILKFL